LNPVAPAFVSRRTAHSIFDAAFDAVISIDSIINNIKKLPNKKALGRYFIRGKVLKPIQKPLAKIRLYLFALT
jgi:hypothetical protein